MAIFPPVRTLIGVDPPGLLTPSLVAGVSYDATRYPLTNLVDRTSKTAWRSSDPIVAIRFDLGYAAAIDYVGVIGHNVDRDGRFSIHASGSTALLGFPPGSMVDDEFSESWSNDLVLSRAFGVRYPNCWVDTRTAAGVATTARYWQLHVYNNTRPVTISEIVIGTATGFEGIITAPFAAQHEAQQTRDLMEYGQAYVSATGAVLRKMDLALTVRGEDVSTFHAVCQNAAISERVIVIPDSRKNDIWMIEWPNLRQTTFEESDLVGTHRLAMVEELFGVV
jgi:hypothetical protein